MGDSFFGGLPAASLPLAGNDLAMVSRDQVLAGRVTLDDLAFYDSIKNHDIVNPGMASALVPKLMTLDQGDGQYFGIAGYGDSMAGTNAYSINVLMLELFNRYGVGSLMSPGFGYSGNNSVGSNGGFATSATANLAISGGAAQGTGPATSDFTFLPTGLQITMPAGSSARVPSPNIGNIASGNALAAVGNSFSPDTVDISTVGWTKATFHYITRPGDGSIVFFAHQPGVLNTAQTPELAAVSITSNSIGLGSRTFTIETGKSFVAGQYILAQGDGAVAATGSRNYIIAKVTSYNSATGELVVDSQFFQTHNGSAITLTSWDISLPSYDPVTVSADAALGSATSTVNLRHLGKRCDTGAYGLGGGTSGNVLFIGTAVWKSKGIHGLNLNRGGSTMLQQNACLANFQTILKPLLDVFSVGVVIHRQRASGDGNDTDGVNFPNLKSLYSAMFDAWDGLNALARTQNNALLINPDGSAKTPSYTALNQYAQLICGESPRITTYDAVTLLPNVPALNAYLRQQSIQRAYAYIDENKAVAIDPNNQTLSVQYLRDTGMAPGITGGAIVDIHLGAPFWRYIATRYRDILGFNLANDFMQVKPVTQASLNRERFSLAALDEMRSHRINGFVGKAITSGAAVGGYTYTPTDQYGYRLQPPAAAAVGYYQGLIGYVPFGATMSLSTANFAVGFHGYRNLQMQPGMRAHIAWGVTSAFNSLNTLAERAFGLEFGHGADVGSPNGVQTEVARFWWKDVATAGVVNYGPWFPFSNSTTQPGSVGMACAIAWDRVAARFTIYAGLSTAQMTIADSQILPAFTTAGTAINICLRSDDSAVPVAPTGNSANCSFAILSAFAKWNDLLIPPYSLNGSLGGHGYV